MAGFGSSKDSTTQSPREDTHGSASAKAVLFSLATFVFSSSCRDEAVSSAEETAVAVSESGAQTPGSSSRSRLSPRPGVDDAPEVLSEIQSDNQGRLKRAEDAASEVAKNSSGEDGGTAPNRYSVSNSTPQRRGSFDPPAVPDQIDIREEGKLAEGALQRGTEEAKRELRDVRDSQTKEVAEEERASDRRMEALAKELEKEVGDDFKNYLADIRRRKTTSRPKVQEENREVESNRENSKGESEGNVSPSKDSSEKSKVPQADKEGKESAQPLALEEAKAIIPFLSPDRQLSDSQKKQLKETGEYQVETPMYVGPGGGPMQKITIRVPDEQDRKLLLMSRGERFDTLLEVLDGEIDIAYCVMLAAQSGEKLPTDLASAGRHLGSFIEKNKDLFPQRAELAATKLGRGLPAIGVLVELYNMSYEATEAKNREMRIDLLNYGLLRRGDEEVLKKIGTWNLGSREQVEDTLKIQAFK